MRMDLPTPTDAELNEAYREWLEEEEAREAIWFSQQEERWDEEVEMRTLAWMLAVESNLSPYEDPDEFICRQDPDQLVDSAQCADCPLNTGCFAIMEGDIQDAMRKIQDDMEEANGR